MASNVRIVVIKELFNYFCSYVLARNAKLFVSFVNKHSFRFPIGFYSQQGEDRIIFETYYRNNRKRGGVFVELGAMDGITYSNTKFFEDVLGWTGILIEPVVEKYEQLLKNRPKCSNFNCAIATKDTALFTGKEATAGIVETMAEAFKREWHSDLRKEDCFEVECKRMSSIINETGFSTIDLFSLDVEGGELEVLHTIDWQSTLIDLFLIELDGHNQQKDDACRQILITHGFKYEKQIGTNELWKNMRL